MMSDYIREFQEKELTERVLREAKSKRIAGWAAAGAAITGLIVAIISL
ncbi:MAG: hypothetical protein J7623_01735 [Chitinophaga sp.]|nr:hypothetical protein [Chitinophaga sp.]